MRNSTLSRQRSRRPSPRRPTRSRDRPRSRTRCRLGLRLGDDWDGGRHRGNRRSPPTRIGPGTRRYRKETGRVMMPRIESPVRGFLEKKKHTASAPYHLRYFVFFHVPKIWLPRLMFCVCVTFEHLSSASRFARACSVGAVQGVALQIVQVAKGRPLRFMRINGRSGGFVRWNVGDGGIKSKYVLCYVYSP
jgi:hypothetical protein